MILSFFLIIFYIFYLVLSSGISFNDFGNIKTIKLYYEKLNLRLLILFNKVKNYLNENNKSFQKNITYKI